ncbi:MAG: NUDIX hydrolase [Actinobacteria bacterium]|nr:NUDIX hydrolase [Actinomycetota bacterium]
MVVPGPLYARIAAVALIDGGGGWFLVRLPDALVPAYTGRKAPAAGIWAPPGGRLDEGETLESALAREMREELSLDVITAGPCHAHLAEHKGECLLAVTMACRPAGGLPVTPVLDPEEAVAWRWVTTTEWLEMADQGLTPWRPRDIVICTAVAERLWRLVDEGGVP